MKAAVLGCGPAGLVAAHALYDAGVEATIFSHAVKSNLYGAQYLHAPIPGIDEGDSIKIDYQLQGTVEDYRRKVYGDTYDGSVSPGSLPPGHPAWDIRQTYHNLWDMYAEEVIDTHIDRYWMQDNWSEWDLILSTIPAPHICYNLQHDFLSREIWAYGEAPDRHRTIGRDDYQLKEGMVICNGNFQPFWYRASLIFGHATIEWPGNISRPFMNCARVVKPISTDCNCWPNVVRLGRYGKWKKGALVHEVYGEAQECLLSRS